MENFVLLMCYFAGTSSAALGFYLQRYLVRILRLWRSDMTTQRRRYGTGSSPSLVLALQDGSPSQSALRCLTSTSFSIGRWIRLSHPLDDCAYGPQVIFTRWWIYFAGLEVPPLDLWSNLKIVIPIGIFASADIALSNMSILYIPLSCTALKTTVPVMAFIFSVFLGLNRSKWQTLVLRGSRTHDRCPIYCRFKPSWGGACPSGECVERLEVGIAPAAYQRTLPARM